MKQFIYIDYAFCLEKKDFRDLYAKEFEELESWVTKNNINHVKIAHDKDGNWVKQMGTCPICKRYEELVLCEITKMS